jgi:hypothetical protein
MAGSAGELTLGVLFAGALRAAVDAEPGGGVGVDVLLREVELVEGVGAGGDLVYRPSPVLRRSRCAVVDDGFPPCVTVYYRSQEVRTVWLRQTL